MGLNKSTGNLYEFVTHSWNPVKGMCPYACSYCYVERAFRRFGKTQNSLRLDEKELQTNLGKGNFIFVCSGCDLFHPDVPDEWRIEVINKAARHDNKYLWHTKNPKRASGFLYPPKSILCVTIESNIPWPGISKAPQPAERIAALKQWKGEKMITVEPIMDFDVMTFSEMIASCNPVQVNIGADSGSNHLPEPSTEKIGDFVDALRHFTRVYLKPNLRRLYKEEPF
jgi:DNA repair photolyase